MNEEQVNNGCLNRRDVNTRHCLPPSICAYNIGMETQHLCLQHRDGDKIGEIPQIRIGNDSGPGTELALWIKG